jgi:hypothetical protein
MVGSKRSLFSAALLMSFFGLVASALAVPVFIPTPTPTATVSCSSLRILIVHADGTDPSSLQSQILAETGVAVVDVYNARYGTGGIGTPSAAQLLQYNLVVAFSNYPWLDNAIFGDNLADYVDAGGVVVETDFGWYGTGSSTYDYNIRGRFLSGNYSPFSDSGSLETGATSLGIFDGSSPLMQGVSSLTDNFYKISTSLSAGAVQVAAWNNGWLAVAYKGHVVGINAFLGNSSNAWSGDYARIIVNAGHWLAYCAPTVTPTSTLTATNTLTLTMTPQYTATHTSTWTQTSTTTSTVTVTPTLTLTSTVTQTPTVTPTFALSTLGKPIVAPQPARRGDKMCLYFTQAPSTSIMEIYNLSGEKIGSVSTQGADGHCWDTTNAAPGVYFVKINIVYADGKKETIWRKVVIIP